MPEPSADSHPAGSNDEQAPGKSTISSEAWERVENGAAGAGAPATAQTEQDDATILSRRKATYGPQAIVEGKQCPSSLPRRTRDRPIGPAGQPFRNHRVGVVAECLEAVNQLGGKVLV